MQELPLEPEVAGDAVDRVADDRQVDRRQVHADLVRPPRLEPDAQQRVRGPSSSSDLEVRDRVARRRRCRASAASGRAGRGRSAPRSGPCRDRGRPRTSARYSRSSARRRTSSCSRPCASSERATTSSPDVSRSSRWTMPGRSASPPAASSASSAVDERAARVPARRMDDDARRLVDDEQVLVLVGDRELERARARAAPASARGARRSTSSPPSSRWLFGRGGRRRPARRPRRSAARRRRASRPRARAARKRSSRARRAQGRRKRRVAKRGRRRCAVGRRASAAKQDRDADDDEAVGEVERRPVPEVEEVRHVPEPHAVDEVRDAAADQRARAPPAAPGGARRSARRRRASRPTATAVSTITTAVAFGEEAERDARVLHVVDRERPERPAPPRPSASSLETMCFVSWSATTAATATATSASHCAARPPASARAVGDGASPSVAEPTRTSSTAGASRRAGSLNRAPRRAAVDALRRPRDRLEALLGDRLAARLADAVRARRRCAPAPRRSPSGLLLGVLLERVVDLAVERRRRRVAEVVVGARRRLAGLVLERPGVLESWFSIASCDAARARSSSGSRKCSVSMSHQVVLSPAHCPLLLRGAARSPPAGSPPARRSCRARRRARDEA